MQLIKGSFAFRAKKAFGWKETVWQKSFSDRRLREINEYANAATICSTIPSKVAYARSVKTFHTVPDRAASSWMKYLSG